MQTRERVSSRDLEALRAVSGAERASTEALETVRAFLARAAETDPSYLTKRCCNVVCTVSKKQATAKLRRCAKCAKTSYCSPECQRAHWTARVVTSHRGPCGTPGRRGDGVRQGDACLEDAAASTDMQGGLLTAAVLNTHLAAVRNLVLRSKVAPEQGVVWVNIDAQVTSLEWMSVDEVRMQMLDLDMQNKTQEIMQRLSMREEVADVIDGSLGLSVLFADRVGVHAWQLPGTLEVASLAVEAARMREMPPTQRKDYMRDLKAAADQERRALEGFKV